MAPWEARAGDRERDGRVRAEIEIVGGRYRLDKELGRGAHTVSWLVTDLRSARPCVLKRLREADAPPAAARLLAGQAAILARLDHPGLPAFVDYIVEGEGAAREHLLLTRFHAGESLEQLVAKGRLPTEAQALGLLRRLVPVLAYLHGFDPPLLHRFLKASNVIIGPDGRPCLADFHFTLEGEEQIAMEGTSAGEESPVFAAPEVATGGAVPASDICALGLTLIYWMSGQDPATFAGEGARSRLRETLKIGDGLAAVLARMVEPALERRYPDASALEADLVRLGAGRVPAAAPQKAPPAPAGGSAPRSSSSGLLPVAIVAMAVLAAGSWYWFRTARQAEPTGDSLVPGPAAPTAQVSAPEGSSPPAAGGGPSAPAVSRDTAAVATPPPAAETAGAPESPPAPVTPSLPMSNTQPQTAEVSSAPAGTPVAESGPAAGATTPAIPPTSVAKAPATADSPAVTGRLLLEGKPVGGLPLPAPVFWIRDEATKAVEKPKVDYAAGDFAVHGLKPGRYGMSVRVNLEPANPNLFPGDLSAWAPFTLEQGRPLALEVPLRTVMRLQQPVDTNAVLSGWEVPCGAGQTLSSRVLFAWAPLGPGATYEARVERLACGRGYAPAGVALARTTPDAWVNVELPPSAEGECYSFRLTASREGRPLGILTTHGKTGFGWDYRFVVK